MRPRRAVAAGVLAVAAIGWLALRGHDAGDDTAVAAAAAVTAMAAASAPAGAEVEPESKAASAAAAHRPEERQICGGAWVKVRANGELDGELPDNAEDIAALRRRTITKLRADPDEYARAVGAWMDDDGVAALVDLALGTRDARVYALAFQSCRRGAVGACSLLSARQWVRLDPGNAAPWLDLLGQAAVRKDAAGVDEALFQIGASARSENGVFRPLLPILDATPSDDRSALATFGLTVQAVGMAVASAMPALAPLRAACSAGSLADANRRQVCERVADVLSERSDDLVTRSIGARMVSDLTGSPERNERQRAEREAWGAADFDRSTDPLEALGCHSIHRTLDRLRDQALLGEVGAMHAWIVQSKLSDKDLLERSRKFEAALAAAGAAMRAAEAAASAASSPP